MTSSNRFTSFDELQYDVSGVFLRQILPGCAQGCWDRVYVGPPWMAIVLRAATWVQTQSKQNITAWKDLICAGGTVSHAKQTQEAVLPTGPIRLSF